MAIPHLHSVQSVRVSSSCRISFPNQYHYGRSNFSRKSSSLIYASTSNFDRDLHLQLKVETVLDSVKWDDKGLAVAIAQNVDTEAILMQGFANREAVATTISSRKATFYSRSQSTLWTKGETSNNFINVQEIFLDCDRDSIIYLGELDGPTCHTGSEMCRYTPVLDLLEHRQRKEELEVQENGKPSWTRRLLSDEKLLCSKTRGGRAMPNTGGE
ncbi:histidine biosynthesis bifunctional protein hisIE, chloroplastic-like isoform X2 [Malus domestica]|uniref:histidine biosynthesis bifunctional protein hisIE, chloroplastic-like isoform X2 n=1 Tax=Malus domestica TaxID=3750 RepID=UPI003974DC27